MTEVRNPMKGKSQEELESREAPNEHQKEEETHLSQIDEMMDLTPQVH